MAQLTDAQLLTKYNDSSTGLFKDNTNKEIVPNRPRSLVTDLTDSFFNKTDDAYTAAFPSTNVAGTDTYTANLIPAITAYASGQKVQLVFANPNTGPATINLNGLGAKAITKNGDSPISAGDITAGQALFLYYDGTQFQIQGGGGGGGGGASDWGDLGGTITDQTDLVTYVDTQISGAIAGLKWKNPARAATAIAGTLATDFENGDTIDGVVLATGDRIVLKNQAAQTENGIYTVNASGAPTRATDADTGVELESATISILEGTVNANTTWVQTTDSVTLGSSNLIWTQFGSTVVDADSATKGIAKLYSTTSLGTNTDGAPTQNAAKVYADAKVADNLTASTTEAPSKTAVNTALALKFTTASASEIAQGLAELATQAEANTGTDDARIVTPLKVKNRDGAIATLTDGATVDITSDKCTLATSSATRTFTVSHTGDDITMIVTLSATSAVYTFPSGALCVSDGLASGDNTCSIAGVSGDKYVFALKKFSTVYYVIANNIGQ